MPLNYNGNTPAAVTYNVNPVSEVTYNGVTVWQAAPASAASEFDIFTESANQEVVLTYTQSAANAITVDWGDGSPTESPSVLVDYLIHEYATSGNYTILIDVASGETWSPGGNISGTTYGMFETTGYLTRVLGRSGMTLSATNAFRNETALLSVVIPSGTATIPRITFDGCYSLISMEWGDDVANIRAGNFTGCTALQNFTFRTLTPPSIGSTTLDGLPVTCNIYVPSSAVATYQAAQYWSARAAYIQAIP